ESGAPEFRLVGENDVPPRLAGEEGADPLLAECAVFVKDVPRGRAAAVDVPGGGDAGILLPPFGDGGGLAGALVDPPAALPVVRAESEIGILHHPRDAAGGRIVVVVLENVTEGGDGLLVGVAVVVPDDLD